MTATKLATARPPRAAICWFHGGALYCEIPCKDGPPYIVRYPATATGLAQALNVQIEHEDRAPNPTPKPDLNAEHPAIKRPKSHAEWATEEQRAKTQEVLRRLKLT